jgi:hypothetical protein
MAETATFNAAQLNMQIFEAQRHGMLDEIEAVQLFSAPANEAATHRVTDTGTHAPRVTDSGTRAPSPAMVVPQSVNWVPSTRVQVYTVHTHACVFRLP